MEKVIVSKIEKVKNVLLVVLVLTTILLLYFLWGSESLEDFIFNDNTNDYKTIKVEDVINPNQIILCRGNEDYTVSFSKKEELWEEQILETFKILSQGTNVFVEEITEEQYTAVMKYPAIIAKFNYDVPFMMFCEKYNIKQLQGYDNINNLTEIGFSKGSTKSAFVFDGNKKKYYRMVGSKELQIFSEVDEMVAEHGFTTYYTLKTFLGEESNNDTLIPVEFPTAITSMEYKKDVETGQNNIIDEMAQNYFGGTFDFVRKVEESNGTIIYMYGYGQKVLIINPNKGSIEYKEEIKTNGSEHKSMFEALDSALAFVALHGGFQTMKGQKINPYLERVSAIDDEENSYRFVFSFMIGKNKLFYEDQMPIIIDVVDGQIAYFRRELINFDVNQSEKRSDEEGFSAINMLAMNYEYIGEILAKVGAIEKEEVKINSFEDLANKINNLYMGYLKPVEISSIEEISSVEQKKLIPVWVVEIEGTLLYFDLYDGQPKGYSKN